LFSSLDQDLAWVVAGVYLIVTLFIAGLLQKLLGHKTPPVNDALRQFLTEAEINEDDIVFPVSMRLGADIVARVNCHSFWWQPGGITDPDMYEEYLHEYPYLSTNWRLLAERHGVTKIVVDDAALEKFIDVYDFSNLQVIAKSHGYTAYDCQSPSVSSWQ